MLDKINKEIKSNMNSIDTDLISDGWHTFGELYYHRRILFIKLCEEISKNEKCLVYKSKKHFDGSEIKGYFNLGIKLSDNSYIAYHMNDSDWDMCGFAKELERSPIEGKYTSKDAINNLMKL